MASFIVPSPRPGVMPKPRNHGRAQQRPVTPAAPVMPTTNPVPTAPGIVTGGKHYRR